MRFLFLGTILYVNPFSIKVVHLEPTINEEFIKLSTFLAENRKFEVDFGAPVSSEITSSAGDERRQKRKRSSETNDDGGKRARISVKTEEGLIPSDLVNTGSDDQQEQIIIHSDNLDDAPKLVVYGNEHLALNELFGLKPLGNLADEFRYPEINMKLFNDPVFASAFGGKPVSPRHVKTRKCRMCDFTSVNCKWRLMCHAQNHLNIKMYSCQACSFKAVQLGNLRTHKRKQHSGMEVEPMKSTTPEEDEKLAQFMAEQFGWINEQ